MCLELQIHGNSYFQMWKLHVFTVTFRFSTFLLNTIQQCIPFYHVNRENVYYSYEITIRT